MTRAAREAQANSAAESVLHGTAPPHFARAPALATPFIAGAAPLPAVLRADMEQRFGQDFSSVRIATDREADRVARGFGAQAVTQGEQIRFAGGALNTGLVAHELVHVLQQRQAGHAQIACAGTGLDKTVMDLRIAIDQAPDAEARKPLVQQALALGDQLAAALATATNTQSPDEEMAAEARSLFLMLGSVMASKGEERAAIELAGKTPDPEVQSSIVNGLASVESIEGQQAVMSQIAPLGGEKVAAPGKPEQGRQWLASNAPAIGKNLAAMDKRGLTGRRRKSMALEKTEQLMAGFMTDSKEDEKPDPTGNPTGKSLRTDDTTHQIKADCDVYATVAARLLREQGWQTVGYMVIVPNEKDPKNPTQDRAAHAVSLARKPDPAGKGNLYVGSSNKTLRELGGEGSVLKDDAAAMQPLVDLMFEVYGSPLPADYDIYYEPAGKGGAYDMRLLDPKNNGLTPWRSVHPAAAEEVAP